MAEAFEFNHFIGLFARHRRIAVTISIGISLIVFCDPSCVFARQGMTCGVDALYEICLQYRLSIPFEKVHAACQPSEKGNSMYDLYQAAEALGFTPRGLRLTWDDLLGLDCPAIAFVQGNHFVAVTGSESGQVRVVDYPQPERLYSKDEFLALWKGETLAVALEKDIEPRLAAASAPRIRFERTLVDFGMVSRGEAVKREFFFWNDGAEPLRIDRVSAGCGCTAPVLSATEIAPGEMGTLNVELDTRGRRGRDTQALALLCNDPLQPKAQLTLTGIVKVELSYGPKQVHFGEVERGMRATRDIYLWGTESKGLCSPELICSDSFLSMHTEVLEKIEAQDDLERVRIAVDLHTSEMPLGKFVSEIKIRLRQSDNSPIGIPVFGEITGPLRVIPRQLFFGSMDLGENSSRQVLLQTDSSDGFEILAWSCNIADVMLNRIDKAGYSITARIRAREAGAFSDIVKIRTNDPKQPIFEIPIFVLIH